jgi:hypothetical protein
VVRSQNEFDLSRHLQEENKVRFCPKSSAEGSFLSENLICGKEIFVQKLHLLEENFLAGNIFFV